MKTAIYGGAFNPVHNEHLHCALAAKQELGLDRVIIVPSNISPHKSGALTLRNKDRLQMCRDVFLKYPGFEVSDCEIKRGGISYSYVTCRHFKKLCPDDELYFIMGADMLQSFPMWREPAQILKCVTPAVCSRGGEEELSVCLKNFYSALKGEAVVFSYKGKNLSSTKIRALAALGEDISPYVPQEVKTAVRADNLYALKEVWGVKKLLTPARWKHTVGVAVFAASGARKFGVAEYDAIVAAALHDCAKYLGPGSPELKGFEFLKGVPDPVMHQYSGAYVAEHTFKITGAAVLDAIRYHTSGRENMSPLEKLIFLADLLEEGRDFEGVEELRALFKKDAEACLYEAFKRQICYLKSQNKPIYPLTERAFKYLKDN